MHLFKPDRPDATIVLQALESALWAPNHKVTEPWRFYLLGPETAAKICQLNYEILLVDKGEAAAVNKLQRWLSFPGWLVITCKRSDGGLREREDYAACCCAAQNFMIHLWSEGIGSKWSTGRATRHHDFPSIVGFDPDEEFPVGLFWFGYPALVPSRHIKNGLDEFLTRRS